MSHSNKHYAKRSMNVIRKLRFNIKYYNCSFKIPYLHVGHTTGRLTLAEEKTLPS